MAQLAVSVSKLPFSGQAWNADICGRVVSCSAGQSMETHHALAPGRLLAAEISRASRAPGCRRMRVIQLAIIYLGCILCWLEKLVQRCRSICIMLERCMLACAIKHRRRMNPFRICLQAHPLTSKICIAAVGMATNEKRRPCCLQHTSRAQVCACLVRNRPSTVRRCYALWYQDFPMRLAVGNSWCCKGSAARLQERTLLPKHIL